MAIENLQGISKEPPYTEETVNQVKDLLNSGVVDVDDVSNYFNVDKSVVIQNLTGISPDAYKQDTRNLTGVTVADVDAIEQLIKKGVASTSDISNYFDAPQEVIERHLVNVRGYNPTALETARAGGKVKDVNRFASFESNIGKDLGIDIFAREATTQPEYLDRYVTNNAAKPRLTNEQYRAEVANILNKAKSDAEITRALRNLNLLTANLPQDLQLAASQVTGLPMDANFLQEGQAFSEFEFRPRQRPYFGPQGQTSGDMTDISRSFASSGRAGLGLSETGGGGIGGSFDITGGGAIGGGAGGGGAGGGLSGTGFYGSTGLGTDYATGSEIPTGLRGSEMALKGGAAGAIAMLDEINRASREDLTTGYGTGAEQLEAAYGRASEYLDPYSQAGLNALQVEQALSGALGQEAFQQAYQESPYIQFLREQGMRENLAGAAATGGLGGGNVQKELVRFGQGLASKGVQDQLANLANISNIGRQASAGLADIQTGLGTEQVRGSRALADALSGMNVTTGLPAAQQIGTLGINLATGRTQAGRDLADQYKQASTALSGIYSGQGRDITSMIDAQRTMLMNMVNSGALTEAQAQEAFATNMANIQAGTGSAIAGVPNAPIFSPDYGAQIGNAFQAAGIGNYLSGRGQQGTQGATVTQSTPSYINPNYGINTSALPGAAQTNYGFNLLGF